MRLLSHVTHAHHGATVVGGGDSVEPLLTSCVPMYIQVTQYKHILTWYKKKHNNESTAGADASVEMPKLHNIKLLII